MPRKTPGPPCVICGKSSVARELCAAHYKRWQRHGHVKQTRSDDWGQRHKHPLWHTWKWTKRVGRHPDWNDFWTFVRTVGERPAPDYRLRRQRIDRPVGPDNWYWAASIGLLQNTKAEKARRQREWRKRNPLRAKEYDLKRKFGIALAEYEQILVDQNGGCAICGQTDKWYSLAVDHCHDTSRIRGLLCSQCNRGIGLFRDSPDLLEKAAAYLRHPTRLI